MNSIEYGLLVKSHGPEKARELLSNRYSVYGDQKPFLIFHDPPTPEAKPHKQHSKSFASRNLKEFISTASRIYEEYTDLNGLWSQYISEVVGKDKDPLIVASKLLTADWNGAFLTVISAQNPSLVGRAGIVLWEAKSMFVVVSPDNKIRQIPKSGATFRLLLGNGMKDVILIGSRLLFRSAERSTRKFKPQDVANVRELI